MQIELSINGSMCGMTATIPSMFNLNELIRFSNDANIWIFLEKTSLLQTETT